jgi:hypothetical protein
MLSCPAGVRFNYQESSVPSDGMFAIDVHVYLSFRFSCISAQIRRISKLKITV